MHTVSYAGNVTSRDEAALEEYGVGILVWGIGIWSHDEKEENERARGASWPMLFKLSDLFLPR